LGSVWKEAMATGLLRLEAWLPIDISDSRRWSTKCPAEPPQEAVLFPGVQLPLCIVDSEAASFRELEELDAHGWLCGKGCTGCVGPKGWIGCVGPRIGNPAGAPTMGGLGGAGSVAVDE